MEDGSTILGEYTYNGEGQRIIKTTADGTTIFIYDFDGNIIAESLSDGTLQNEYLYMNGTRIVRVRISDEELFFYGNDLLGTPIIITDDTSKAVWEAEYKPFGEAVIHSESTVSSHFRFPGQYYDNETGFHYNYHRYYDPSTGRYLTPDPIGLEGGINRYAYVGNNVVNEMDLSGLILEKIWNDPTDRGKHLNEAKTMEQFIEYSKDKSLKQLQHEVDRGTRSDRSAAGPTRDYRYVINPNNSSEVIDMRHFLVVGEQGEFAGLLIEILQFSGDRASSFDAQDFLSNALGSDFFNEYNPSNPLDYELKKYFFGIIEDCE